MTDAEWTDLAACLRHWWPGDFTDGAAEAYRLALGRFDAAAVAAALGARLDAGARFRPSAAELASAILGRSTSARPSAAEAWALIEEAIRRVGCSIYDPEFDARHRAAIGWLAGQDEVLAAFAARRGLCQMPGSLGQEPVNDPEYGGAVRARIGRDWTEAVTVAADREARGLPAVPAGALEPRATGESGGMGDLVERLRPARELGPGS